MKILIKRDFNKKKDAKAGAENNKKIPILNPKYPIFSRLIYCL